MLIFHGGRSRAVRRGRAHKVQIRSKSGVAMELRYDRGDPSSEVERAQVEDGTISRAACPLPQSGHQTIEPRPLANPQGGIPAGGADKAERRRAPSAARPLFRPSSAAAPERVGGRTRGPLIVSKSSYAVSGQGREWRIGCLRQMYDHAIRLHLMRSDGIKGADVEDLPGTGV